MAKNKEAKKKFTAKPGPEVEPEKTEPTEPAKPEAPPEPKPIESAPDCKTFIDWAAIKHFEGSAAGASVRFKIDLKEKMTEKEFDGYIAKWRNS